VSDFIGDAYKECVTHHHACDCREDMFVSIAVLHDQLKADARELVDALEGFEKFCIKPECICFACEALAVWREKHGERS